MDEGLELSEMKAEMHEGLSSIGDGAELSLMKGEDEENVVLKTAATDMIRKMFNITEVSFKDIISNCAIDMQDWNLKKGKKKK